MAQSPIQPNKQGNRKSSGLEIGGGGGGWTNSEKKEGRAGKIGSSS